MKSKYKKKPILFPYTSKRQWEMSKIVSYNSARNIKMLAGKRKKIIQDMSAENYKPLQKVPEELKKLNKTQGCWERFLSLN